MRVETESDLLDPATRKQIILEIEGRENQTRKFEAYRRYQCYKDKTSQYVVDLLLRQFDTETVEEMRYCLSNISIVKKVIDKLARVYNHGVEREISGDEDATKRLKDMEKRLDLNSVMKKTNRFLKLTKNVDLFVKPCPVYGQTKADLKWTVKLEALVPYLYDVVEDYYDRSKSIAVILSDYQPPYSNLAFLDGKRSPLPAATVPTVAPDGKDQIIADSKVDHNQGQPKTYVFWSKSFHFTCDANGEIIPDETNPNSLNPLKVFNHINFSIDQDGGFWAEGGDDLVDGAVLINAMVTHTLHVGTVQGYGQFYMTGENLPRSVKVGPTKAIIAEYKKDEQAKPEMGFLNASPQLGDLQSLIEMYIALYLTTNNLSTSGVATQLSGSQTLPSGIALIIDKAESMEDTQDQRQVFLDREPKVIGAINAALVAFESHIVDELKDLKLPEGWEKNFNVKFHDAVPIMSESEKLGIMKAREELGIDTMISLLMKDDPTLTEEQAEEKLKKIVVQRIKEKMLEQSEAKNLGYEGGDLYEGQETEEEGDETLEEDEGSEIDED